jgi:hypothetical protein
MLILRDMVECMCRKIVYHDSKTSDGKSEASIHLNYEEQKLVVKKWSLESIKNHISGVEMCGTETKNTWSRTSLLGREELCVVSLKPNWWSQKQLGYFARESRPYHMPEQCGMIVSYCLVCVILYWMFSEIILTFCVVYKQELFSIFILSFIAINEKIWFIFYYQTW